MIHGEEPHNMIHGEEPPTRLPREEPPAPLVTEPGAERGGSAAAGGAGALSLGPDLPARGAGEAAKLPAGDEGGS